MSAGRTGRATLAALALALCLAVRTSAAAPADSAAAEPRPHLGRGDAAFALLAAGAVAGTSAHDPRWLAQVSASRSPFAVHLADAARQLGEPVPMGAALLAADGIARLAHRERAAAATERMAFACVAAGAVSLVVKSAVGRERPDESSVAWRTQPLSGHDSFPSGHATVAFALAASLDAETRSPLVRTLAYSAAAVTAWSRVRDRKHWPSDVVAGAAIGGWCAYRADGLARAWFPRGLAVVVLPHAGGARLQLGGRF